MGSIFITDAMVADGREGIHGLTLSNAMHLSDRLGKAVELPLDEELFYEDLSKRIKNSRGKAGGAKTVVSDLEATYGSTPTGEHQKRWNTNW